MKFISVVHISTLASLASAGGFGQRGVNKPYASGQLSEVLNIRGGGTKENLVTAFTALNGLHGIVSMAAPEKVPDIFYQGTFEIDEGTLAETYQEHVGSALAGMALLTYLAAFTDMSTTSAIAWSSVPCFYSHGRRLLKTGYAKLGYNSGFDTFWNINVFLIMPIMSYAIISGNYDSDLLAKIYVGIPGVMGLLGKLFPDAVNSAAGLTEVDEVSSIMGDWWNSSLLMFGVLGISLLTGSDAFEAVGRTALLFGLMVADGNFIRKKNAPLNLTDASNYLFPLIQLLIGIGLLKPEGAVTASE